MIPAWTHPRRSRRRRRRRGFHPRAVLRNFSLLVAAILALPQLGDYAASLKPMTGECRVTQVVDGDTVWLACPGEAAFSARLTGFDAPEIFSPGCASEAAAGYFATQHLRYLVWTASDIQAGMRGTDRYGRRLVDLHLDGERVADLMVATGHARPYDGGRRAGWCT